MTILEIPSESVEYVTLAVASRTDPTAGAVEVGFTETGETTAPATFGAATWTGVSVELVDGKYQESYLCRALLGTGDLALDEGEHTPWVRITLGAETVVRRLEDDVVRIV